MLMRKSIRVLLADDHEVVRRGLRDMIEEAGYEVCAEASDGREAVRLAVQLAPNVAILDLVMPELTGLEATRQIRREQSVTEVLIFSMHDSDDMIRQVLLAGARGYLVKSDPSGHLLAAIEALAQRKPFFTGRVCESILATYLGHTDETPAERIRSSLTPREREVLQLLAEGKSNKRVAMSLGISVKTTEAHRAAIMRKLGVTSVVELVRYALRNGLAMP